MTTVIQACEVKSVASQNNNVSEVDIREREDRTIKDAKSILFQRLMQTELILLNPSVSKDFLLMELSQKESEEFHALFLDNQHRLIKAKKLFKGTIDQCNIYPREVVKAALELNAAAIIFAHNHPSQLAEPSQSDIVLTKRLIGALALLDIRVLDHFIVGGTSIITITEQVRSIAFIEVTAFTTNAFPKTMIQYKKT